jgi:hypothetical protein
VFDDVKRVGGVEQPERAGQQIVMPAFSFHWSSSTSASSTRLVRSRGGSPFLLSTSRVPNASAHPFQALDRPNILATNL